MTPDASPGFGIGDWLSRGQKLYKKIYLRRGSALDLAGGPRTPTRLGPSGLGSPFAPPRNKSCGRPWCQGVHLPVPAAVRGTTEGECGLISKLIHSQLARCNPLFHFLINCNNNENNKLVRPRWPYDMRLSARAEKYMCVIVIR